MINKNVKLAIIIKKESMKMERNLTFDKEKTYHKAKLLLKIYRDVIWSIEDRVAELEEKYRNGK